MIQSEATFALKVQKKKGRCEGANEKKAAHGGTVPPSESPPEGGWSAVLVITSAGDVFGVGPLPF